MARAQACAAELARLQDDYSDAEARAEASWSLAQDVDDKAAIALALIPLGWADYTRNNFTAARQRFEASLQLFRQLANPGYIASVLHDLAYLALVQGEYTGALTYYKEELALSRASGHTQGVFWALHGMGCVAEGQGDLPRAAAFYKQCLALAQGVAAHRWDCIGAYEPRFGRTPSRKIHAGNCLLPGKRTDVAQAWA